MTKNNATRRGLIPNNTWIGVTPVDSLGKSGCTDLSGTLHAEMPSLNLMSLPDVQEVRRLLDCSCSLLWMDGSRSHTISDLFLQNGGSQFILLTIFSIMSYHTMMQWESEGSIFSFNCSYHMGEASDEVADKALTRKNFMT